MRHAQKHWLDTQAREAVRLAMTDESGLADDLLAGMKTNLDRWGDDGHDTCEARRSYYLTQAAEYLIRAEMCHRASVK